MYARQVHTFRPLVLDVRLKVYGAYLLFLVETDACGGLRCVYFVSFCLWSDLFLASRAYRDGGPGPRHHWQLYGHRAQALSFQ